VLTVAAARQEHKVLLADFDPEQLSCVEWSAMRLRNGIAPDIEERVFNKLKTLRETASEFDLAFVDTRGLADELTKGHLEKRHIFERQAVDLCSSNAGPVFCIRSVRFFGLLLGAALKNP